MKAKFITFVRGLKKGTPPRFQSYLRSLTLLLVMVVSVNIGWAGGSKELGTYTFTNGATMPTGVTNSNGAAFATTRFALKSSSAYITIDNLSIPSNATDLYVAVNCVENGNKTETITVSGLNSSGTAIVSAIFSPKQGSNLSSATAIDNACEVREVNFSAANVVKIKIQATTFGNNFLIHDVVVSCDVSTAPKTDVNVSAGSNGSVKAYSDADCTSEITISSNKISVSQNSTVYFKATSNTGYVVDSWTGATANPSDNTKASLEVGTTEATVSVSFKTAPKHKVYWSQNGDVSKYDEVAEGAAITFPETASGCEGKTFMGWVGETDKNYQSEKTAPTYITSATMGTQDITYYAVFADGSSSQSTVEGFPVNFTTSNYTGITVITGTTATITSSANISVTSSALCIKQQNSGAYWLFTIPVKNFTNADSVTISLGDVKVSNNNYKFTYKFQYSVDGSTYSDFPYGGTYTETTTASTVKRGIKPGSAIASGNLYIKVLSTSGGGTGGGNHYIKTANITVTKGIAENYSNYTTTCCTKHEVKKGTVAIGGFTATPAQACADVEITLVPEEVTGYNFTGWTSSPNVTITDNKFSMPNEDVTITANYEAISYNITYNRDGGNWTGAEGVDSYTYGTGATLPTADDITKANNTFLGWYVTNPAEIVTSIDATETGDKSFTASWLPNGARDVAYSGGAQLNYISNPSNVGKDDASLTVTYSVNKGYTISAVAVTVDDAALTEEGEVMFNDEQLTITPTAGFTGNVSITFTVVEKMFTVTWMANKTQFKQVQIQEGSKVTLPAETPSDVISGEDTYKFQGWIVDEQYSSDDTPPAYIANNTIEPAGDVTYYAVYAIVTPGPVSNDYAKITATTDLVEDGQYIIASGTKALNSDVFSQYYLTATGVTISNNKITTTNAKLVWTIDDNDEGDVLFKSNDNGNYLQIIDAGSGHYNLVANSDEDGDHAYFTPSVSSGNWTLKSYAYKSYYVSYNSNYNEFTANTSASNLQLYKRQNNPDTYKNYRTRVAVIDYIAVNGTPVTTNYVADETFDATGLSIDVYYKDEDTPTNVTEGFTFAPTGALKTTDENITFSYQGKQVLLPISVSNTVSGIEVTTNPTKKEYTEGQQFDPAGMVVTATYDNSAERDVTGYDYEPKGDLALGNKITISFGGQTTDLAITINPATKTTVNWFVEGNAYTAGEPSTAVIPGKKITALPSEPAACQGNQFVGWTTQETYYNATTAPTDLFKTLDNAPTIGSETANFYAVFASEAVGTYDEKVTLTSLTAPTADKFTYAFAKSSGTTSPSWNADQAKTYVKNTLTVTSKNSRIITKIEYTYNINKNDKGTAPTSATVTGNNSDNGSWDATNKTWTSSTNAATTVTLTVNGSAGNYGFTAIKVYLTGGTVLSDYSTTCLAALANPTITTPEGEYCGSVDVEITQPAGNPEGAKIMYSTNNETWNEYSVAVNITTSGTVYAKVVKAPKETEVVSATYTIYPAYTLAQAAAAASATSQIACLTFTDLLVQARSQNEVFLKASDGQIVLLSKSSHGLNMGDKLVADNAHLNFIKSHDLLQLTSMEGIEKNGTGTPVADVKTITEITSANYGQLVKIMNVTYDATNKKFTDASSNEIAIDAKFFVGGSLPASWPDGGKFNATGVVVLDNNSNAVIAPRNTDDLESLATPLEAPTNFVVTSVNSYRASYSWTAVDNNVGYTLYIYDGDEQIYKSNTIGATVTEYAPQKNLEAGHAYTAKLVALGDKAEHSDSPAAEVEFTTNPNAKLNWYVGDNEEPYVTYASQEKVVTPEDPESPCATNYENFVTWYTEEIVSETGQITALDAAKKVKAGDAAASQAGSAKEYNFYAVFGKIQKAGTDKYVKVTEAQDNWKGEYLIGYDEGDGKDALTVFNGSLTTLDAENDYKTVSLETDGSIVANETNNSYRFNIEKSTTEGYYTIQSASGKYIANTTNSNGMSESSTTAYKNTITWAERVDIATGENATASHLSFNSASDQLRFRYYKTDKKNIVLYKREKTNPQYSGYITTCPVTYKITIAENAKGLVEAAKTTEILKGASVKLTATAYAGYTKTGGAWVVKNTTTGDVVEGLVGGTNFLTMPDYDVTIDYNFQEKKDQFVDNLHGNTTIEKGGADYELPTLTDFEGETGKPSDNFKKFIGWSATSYDSGEPATEQPTILEGNQTATDATYFAVWSNGSGKYITEYCQTSAPASLHLVEEYHKATSVRIDWNNVDGADKYHIIVMDNNTEIIADADVTESLYDLSGLTPGATYICTVKAHKNCWSDETEEYEFTTKENIQSYVVTINAEGGTYEIEPELEDGKIQEGATVTISNIAVTDATIHYFKELTVPEATDLVEVEGGYMFTMPGKPVTINIVFAEFPKVTWMMEGQEDIVTSSVRQDDKFVVGTVQPAPATWTFKEYYKEFAGWMVNDDLENPVFATAATEVPAEGLVVNGAVAKSGKADMDNATKVTSNANLDMTAHYVIGGEKNSTSYFFSDYESVDTQLGWGLVTTDVTTAAPLVFTLSGTASELAIQDNRGNYLVEPSKNKTITMSSTKGTVSLDATGNIKSGTSFYFRLNTSSLGVRWYNEQTVEQAYLYKVGLIYDNLTTDPSGTQIRPDAKVGMISGICYKRDIVAHSGATFYYLSQKASDESYIELTEVTGVLHAGYPYLFEASDNEIRVIFDGEEVQDGPYNYNGLYGTFENTPLGDGYCIILNNKYYRTHDGNNNGCYAYRAYLKLDEVSYDQIKVAPGETEQPVNAPRRIRMGGDGVNTPTGFDNIFGNDAEAIQKMIINNQLIIFRQGKRYNAAGALMK